MSVSSTCLLYTKTVGWKNEFCVPITIFSVLSKKTIEATAIIDSGAGGTFIDADFVRRNRIRTHQLSRPFHITTVDGSHLKARQVNQYCMLYVRIDKRVMFGKFNITKLSKKDDILLSKPWLSAINPDID
jgi:hypothetical protein